MVATEMSRRAARGDDEEKPRKLPVLERKHRLETLQARLVGLKIQGPLEPADSLIDKLVQMQEVGEIRWLKWEDLPRRSSEVKGEKKEEFFKANRQGLLQHSESDAPVFADVSTDAKIKYALQRRSIGCEVARLASFEGAEVVTTIIEEEMEREALPGHSKVTIDQAIAFDQEVWIRAAQLSRGALDMIGDVYPLDAILAQVILEPRIIGLLSPLKLGGGGASSSGQAAKIANLEAAVKRLSGNGNSGPSKQQRQANGNRKGKGKGGGGNKSGTPMPAALIGMNPVINGERACFDYNLSSCKKAINGKCPKGVHKCMRPGCGKAHPQFEH